MRVKRVFCIVLAVFSLVSAGGCSRTYDYEGAKEEVLSFFREHEEELTEIAEELLPKSHQESVDFGDFKLWNYNALGQNYVELDFDGQGMLGGQYWGLVYCKDDSFGEIGEDIYIYDENSLTGKGNNISIKERIDGNWFYFYDDYDGHVDLSKIGK